MPIEVASVIDLLEASAEVAAGLFIYPLTIDTPATGMPVPDIKKGHRCLGFWVLFWIFDTTMQCGKRARLVNFEGNSVEVVSKVKLSRKNR